MYETEPWPRHAAGRPQPTAAWRAMCLVESESEAGAAKIPAFLGAGILAFPSGHSGVSRGCPPVRAAVRLSERACTWVAWAGVLHVAGRAHERAAQCAQAVRWEESADIAFSRMEQERVYQR